jgi:hypothetical protein
MAIFNTVPPLKAGSGIQFDGESISTRATPRNLLDNSNFLQPVNQRLQTTYKGPVYTIDRWRLWQAAGAVNVTDLGIAVSGDRLFSYVGLGLVDEDGLYTLAAKTSDGALDVVAGVPRSGVAGAKCHIGYDANADKAWVALEGGHTYVWAALYEGVYTAETLPEYQPKGYSAELQECMRYFSCIRAWRAVQGDIGWDGSTVFFARIPTIMRINPTASNIKGTLYANGSAINIDEVPAEAINSGDGLQIRMTTKHTEVARHAGFLELGNVGINFSADL